MVFFKMACRPSFAILLGKDERAVKAVGIQQVPLRIVRDAFGPYFLLSPVAICQVLLCTFVEKYVYVCGHSTPHASVCVCARILLGEFTSVGDDGGESIREST